MRSNALSKPGRGTRVKNVPPQQGCQVGYISNPNCTRFLIYSGNCEKQICKTFGNGWVGCQVKCVNSWETLAVSRGQGGAARRTEKKGFPENCVDSSLQFCLLTIFHNLPVSILSKYSVAYSTSCAQIIKSFKRVKQWMCERESKRVTLYPRQTWMGVWFDRPQIQWDKYKYRLQIQGKNTNTNFSQKHRVSLIHTSPCCQTWMGCWLDRSASGGHIWPEQATNTLLWILYFTNTLLYNKSFYITHKSVLCVVNSHICV